jgi:hypothetical protein
MSGMTLMLRQTIKRSWFALLIVVVLLGTMIVSTPTRATLLGSVPSSTYGYYAYLATILK